ncbi:MAG TPA: LysM peptidoglycan-binding domain-containing protein [Gemmatimonadaceae bacterium]|nr:LysM peptidoglycan-binding domain-containing protein [Gemmatimonadaceae bacterium]
MATPASSVDTEQPDTPSAPRQPLLRRARHNVPAGVWYALGAIGVALLVIIVQLVVHGVKSDPRNSRAIVERELHLNTIQPGERVIRMVPVFRRNAVDYYRQTRGYLVLTDKRLLYLGAPPRDITVSSDAPPTFDQREFPIDTLTALEPSFAMLGFARAIRIESPGETLKLGVQRSSWPKAQLLRESFSSRHRKLEGLGQWAKRVRDARAQLQQIVAAYRKQPVYHVVRPGDALGSIATWYEVSPDQIRKENGIVGNKIKVGQRLLIRSGS